MPTFCHMKGLKISSSSRVTDWSTAWNNWLMIEAIRRQNRETKTISSRYFLYNVYFRLDKVAASLEKSHKYFNLIWKLLKWYLNVLHDMSLLLLLLLIFSHWSVSCNFFNNFVTANKSLFAFHWVEGAENEKKRSCLSIKLINNKRYSEFVLAKVFLSLATHFKKKLNQLAKSRFLRQLNYCCFYFLCQLPFLDTQRSLTWFIRFFETKQANFLITYVNFIF